MPLRQLRIVLTGGTGQIGKILARHFIEQGHDVTVVGRYPRPSEWKTYHWDGYHIGDWADCVDGSDVVINLAGRSVNCRYTNAHRREILYSRTITTGLVGEAIARSSNPPKVWLNASSATIYRQSFDRGMDETGGELGGDEPGRSPKLAFQRGRSSSLGKCSVRCVGTSYPARRSSHCYHDEPGDGRCVRSDASSGAVGSRWDGRIGPSVCVMDPRCGSHSGCRVHHRPRGD